MADAVAEQVRCRYPDKQDESKQFLAIMAEFIADSGASVPVTGFGRALSYLSTCGFKIHLLFDEFDLTARNPDLGDPFYDALRGLPTRAGNISYVIATRTGLVALQPTYSQVSSPFFNIFTTITLTPFQKDEVYDLIFGYFARGGLDVAMAEKLCTESASLYDVTGYHPFFLQMFCYHLCTRLGEPGWPLGQAWQEALRVFEKNAEPHFEYYWQVSSQEERGLIKRFAVQKSVDWNQPGIGAPVKSLEDRCLIVQTRKVEGEWRLFSSAFSNWVNSGLQKADVPVSIPIPAGPFWMGSSLEDAEAHDNEKPRRRLELQEYRIGRYPVTNAQYACFLAANSNYPVPYMDKETARPYNWDHQARTYPEGKADHPVVLVSWEDADAYCRWLSRVTGQHYRLPTEEEWEKAARGGFPGAYCYPWGDVWQPGCCNTKELGRNETTSVREFEQVNQSPFGVADMAGNVLEWTASWYEPYAGSPYPSVHYGRLRRVVRGGSWLHLHSAARISCRGRYEPSMRRPYLGFRIAVD
jgi:formylglycine-generating enzyme required for sulfatase activity